MSEHKKYVSVIARFDDDGRVIPLIVLWEDGRKFSIDKILDMRRASSLKAGGVGMRYRVKIGRNETFLFYEGDKWFVEI